MVKKLIAFLCAFMYFASPYQIANHALPEIIGLCAIFLAFFQHKKIKMPEKYGVYFLYMLFIPPLVTLAQGIPGNYLASFVPIALIYYTIFFVLVFPQIDCGFFLSIYRSFVWLSVAFFIIQEISFLLIGWRPTAYLPLDMCYDEFSSDSFGDMISSAKRSPSFFLEPAHFIQYIFPYYCLIAVRAIHKKKSIIEFLLLTIVVVLAQSGAGFVALLALTLFLLFANNGISLKRKCFATFIIVLGTSIVFYYFGASDFVLALTERTKEFSFEVERYGAQSGFLRMWRGYFIYGSLSELSQVFGVAVGSFEYVSSGVFIDNVNYTGTYMNGIQTLLVGGGIVGTFLFFRFLFHFYNKSCISGKAVLITMIAFFLVEHMYYTPKMCLCLLTAYSINKYYINEYRKKENYE